MSEQPEALRLAEILSGGSDQFNDEAAAELRRLYELAMDQHSEIYGLRLKVRNLLRALELCEGNISSLLASAHPKVYGEWLAVVSDAIKTGKGKTK